MAATDYLTPPTPLVNTGATYDGAAKTPCTKDTLKVSPFPLECYYPLAN